MILHPSYSPIYHAFYTRLFHLVNLLILGIRTVSDNLFHWLAMIFCHVIFFNQERPKEIIGPS